MKFANGSTFEMKSNLTFREDPNDEWVDVNSVVNCLGGWFKLPSGKVVCHITTTKSHKDRKTFCTNLGKFNY